MATALGDALPTSGDPETNNNYADDINAAITNNASEHATKTINQNYADKVMSRPNFKDYAETVYAHGNVSGAVTVDLENGNHQTMTLTGDVTLTVSNPSPTGNRCFLALDVTQDGAGGRTVTFPSAFKDSAGSTFSISGTTASETVEVFARTDDAGTLWRTKQGETWS